MVTVSGSGFDPNETVFIYFNAAVEDGHQRQGRWPRRAAADRRDGPSRPTDRRAGADRARHQQQEDGDRHAHRADAGAKHHAQPDHGQPGNTVTVTGKASRSKEQVTLALNGAARHHGA